MVINSASRNVGTAKDKVYQSNRNAHDTSESPRSHSSLSLRLVPMKPDSVSDISEDNSSQRSGSASEDGEYSLASSYDEQVALNHKDDENEIANKTISKQEKEKREVAVRRKSTGHFLLASQPDANQVPHSTENQNEKTNKLTAKFAPPVRPVKAAISQSGFPRRSEFSSVVSKKEANVLSEIKQHVTYEEQKFKPTATQLSNMTLGVNPK